MRFIDLDILEAPKGWEKKVRASVDAIAGAAVSGDVDKLKHEVSKAAKHWPGTKPALASMSFDKCWYCESRDCRSDFNVDHFRPKSKVAEAPGHPGYWWLALDVSNFRLSCQFCNQRRRGVDGASSGGKADHFPVNDEADRAKSPSDPIEREHVVLLDPTEALDTVLLTFGYDGMPSPNAEKCPPGSFEAGRVDASIYLYHLNQKGIVDARKKLNRFLKRSFDDAVYFVGIDKPDLNIINARKNAVESLKRALSEQAELSSTAKAYIRSRRADGGIADVLASMLLEH